MDAGAAAKSAAEERSRKRKITQWKTLQTSLFSAAKLELRLFSCTKFREEGLCRLSDTLLPVPRFTKETYFPSKSFKCTSPGFRAQ